MKYYAVESSDLGTLNYMFFRRYQNAKIILKKKNLGQNCFKKL